MTVVLTGTSKGIGRALINFFLERGDTVLALSSNPEATPVLHPKLQYIKVDFANMQTVFEAAQEIKKNTQRVDILINNAATLINKPFSSISISDFENSYRINVEAPFFLTQQLTELMGGATCSHIVNISSMGGFMGSAKFAGLSVYSSSKGALATLTECLAEELKEKNIRCNCLCLGAVQTEMLQQAFPGYQAPVNARQMAQYIGRFALEASFYMNGKVIPLSLSTP